jgi:glycosyltransferase involved in cell wall biosynthesis
LPPVTEEGVGSGARVTGALRHPLIGGKIALWRWGRDPARLAVVLARLLPAGGIRRVPLPLLTGLALPFPSAAFLLLERGGHRGAAISVAATHRRSQRARRRLAALGSALDQPIAVGDHQTPAAPGSPAEARNAIHHARVAARAGQLTEAIDLLKPLCKHRKVAALLERYEGERLIYGEHPIPAAPRLRLDPVRSRVVHLVTNALPFARAGYTLRTHKIAQAQGSLGLDPHVVTGWGWPVLQGYLAAARDVNLDGVSYHRLLPGRDPLPATTAALLERGTDATMQLVRQWRPAVLHAASGHQNGTVALAIRERTGLPVIYEVRGFLEESRASRLDGPYGADEQYALQRHRETQIMQEADAVVTLAGTMREEIVARGVPRDKIVLAPNAVDTDLLTSRYDGLGFRARYGIGPSKFVVGSVSSLTSYEGFSTLLEAVALLRDEGSPVRVLLVGDGAERPALLAQVEQLGLGDRAVLPGRVGPTAAMAAYCALDVFVVPRRDVRVAQLVTPLKPVEAMALGVPVIASRLPALAELLADGRAGLLVPPEDPRALADAIARIRGDTALRADLLAAGRDEVAQRRTWQQVARSYRKLYEQLGAC